MPLPMTDEMSQIASLDLSRPVRVALTNDERAALIRQGMQLAKDNAAAELCHSVAGPYVEIDWRHAERALEDAIADLDESAP